MLYEKLNFTKSKFPEFNKCINKKFKNNNIFPTYYELHKVLKKCAENHGMKIHKVDFEAEGKININNEFSIYITECMFAVKVCFQELGNLLQSRRREDLYLVHKSLLNEHEEDPAAKDVELSNTLKEHRKKADQKLSDLVHE